MSKNKSQVTELTELQRLSAELSAVREEHAALTRQLGPAQGLVDQGEARFLQADDQRRHYERRLNELKIRDREHPSQDQIEAIHRLSDVSQKVEALRATSDSATAKLDALNDQLQRAQDERTAAENAYENEIHQVAQRLLDSLTLAPDPNAEKARVAQDDEIAAAEKAAQDARAKSDEQSKAVQRAVEAVALAQSRVEEAERTARNAPTDQALIDAVNSHHVLEQTKAALTIATRLRADAEEKANRTAAALREVKQRIQAARAVPDPIHDLKIRVAVQMLDSAKIAARFDAQQKATNRALKAA
jgi:chromosome segregation ATPase